MDGHAGAVASQSVTGISGQVAVRGWVVVGHSVAGLAGAGLLLPDLALLAVLAAVRQAPHPHPVSNLNRDMVFRCVGIYLVRPVSIYMYVFP